MLLFLTAKKDTLLERVPSPEQLVMEKTIFPSMSFHPQIKTDSDFNKSEISPDSIQHPSLVDHMLPPETK